MTPLEELFTPQNWPADLAGPRYIQLKQRIARAIKNHNLPPGTAFPPERVLAEMSGLSRVTIRKAFAPLVEAGLIDRAKALARWWPSQFRGLNNRFRIYLHLPKICHGAGWQ